MIENRCVFYLGVPQPSWAWSDEIRGPVMVAAPRLAGRRWQWPAARVPVAVDSGAFGMLAKYGCWPMSADEYVRVVRRLHDELGIVWAAIQDWIVTPDSLRKTGLSVREHQRRTTDSLARLRGLAPEIPWVPVLHGVTVADYVEHARLYAQQGFDLGGEALVGLGSIARRQDAPVLLEIVWELAVEQRLCLHGFGVKARGLERVGALLGSADSMEWSLEGRRRTQKTMRRPGQVAIALAEPYLVECRDTKGRRLANSPEWAEQWRARMLGVLRSARVPERNQLSFAWECSPATRRLVAMGRIRKPGEGSSPPETPAKALPRCRDLGHIVDDLPDGWMPGMCVAPEYHADATPTPHAVDAVSRLSWILDRELVYKPKKGRYRGFVCVVGPDGGLYSIEPHQNLGEEIYVLWTIACWYPSRPSYARTMARKYFGKLWDGAED